MPFSRERGFAIAFVEGATQEVDFHSQALNPLFFMIWCFFCQDLDLDLFEGERNN